MIHHTVDGCKDVEIRRGSAGPELAARVCLLYRLATLTAGLFLLAWIVPYSSVTSANQLNLTRHYAGTSLGVESIENPHDYACSTCHQPDGTGKGDRYPLHDDMVTLCRSCHITVHFHKVGMLPLGDKKELGRIWLPLGRGSRAGQVVCTTCHYIHAPLYRPALLRGDEEGPGTREQNLCAACHTRRPVFPYPHDGAQGSCIYCNPVHTGGGNALPLQGRVNPFYGCGFCHSDQKAENCLDVNPFNELEDLGDLAELGIPLIRGRFTCVNCHDPHDTGKSGLKLLRPAFLSLAVSSRRINPHWKDVLCVSCHCSQPREGELLCLTAWDIEIMCGRCHDGVHARRDIHPVGVPPSPVVSIPPSMPLVEGKITCLTCHDSSLQKGGEGRASVRGRNPSFLRGGYTVRDQFCFRCHRSETYRLINAHAQVDEAGSLKVQICLFCHSSLPDRRRWSIENTTFDDESIDGYCTCCHEGYEEGHPVGGDHLVSPSEKVLAVIEGSVAAIGAHLPLYNGRVTCVTCHNPHEAGVITIEVSARGSKNKNRLRLGGEDSELICRGCHADR